MPKDTAAPWSNFPPPRTDNRSADQSPIVCSTKPIGCAGSSSIGRMPITAIRHNGARACRSRRSLDSTISFGMSYTTWRTEVSSLMSPTICPTRLGKKVDILRVDVRFSL